jgi:hypothetical protein
MLMVHSLFHPPSYSYLYLYFICDLSDTTYQQSSRANHSYFLLKSERWKDGK